MEDSLEDFIKLTRSTKEVLQKEAQTPKVRKQDVILTQRKKECESRAAKIVEFLIEGKLRSEVFLRCLKHINQSYYQDVVEERAISNICGYSLCGNQIPIMPDKQFFIDTKYNKVYDLTDRKNYCSNFCYRASLYIKLQIDNSPLWLRNIDEARKVNILASSERGSPGEEINQCIITSINEPSFVSVASFTEVCLEDVSNNEIKNNKSDHNRFGKKQTLQTLDELDELPAPMEPRNLSETSHFNADAPKQTQTLSSIYVNAHSNHFKKSQKHSKSKRDFKKMFENIKKSVHEWITLETYIYLFGEELLKNHIDENRLEQYFANLKLAESTIFQQERYQEICKKLHLNQLVEDSFDNSVLGGKIEPVPDYSQLKTNSQNLQLKVHSFYSGDLYEIGEVDEIKIKNQSANEIPQQVEDNPAVLPLVDVNSQNALRRKIYLHSISKVMVALTKGLQIPSQHILEELNLLVKTFKLQAHNITFEPFVWSIITLILIKMLSIREDSLKAQLNTKQSKVFVNAMLNQVPNADIFLQDLLDDIGNIKLFFEQYFVN